MEADPQAAVAGGAGALLEPRPFDREPGEADDVASVL
jgi:hypothetical protein